MFVTNWNSTTKIQKISEITNFFRHYFLSRTEVYFATMKNVEIVGEAAYMLTKEFKASHPEIPWKQVEGMRHVLVHGYSQVLPRILWATAKENIPEIKAQVEKYLNETDWEHYCGE